MAQTEANMLGMSIGIEHGSTNTCQRCGGQLRVVEGTDVEDCEEKGGFREEYECNSCKQAGTYWFQYHSNKERFLGVCADYDY